MMENIAHKLIVLSGKGGVGKSTIAVNLAVWLSMQGNNVGLLDIDIHGPSIPKLLNLDDKSIEAEGDKIKPILYNNTLKVMSIGFLLPDESNAVIWRGPMKHNLIKQFTTDIDWGWLDFLVVDCPPGTGDEPLSIIQLIGNADGAVIVTTPQQLSVIDVKKCITFCRQLNVPVLGVIENMSGFVCPYCNKRTDIFKSSGGEQMAKDFSVPFLGSIPIDSNMVHACDAGKPFIQFNNQNSTAQAIYSAFALLMQTSEQNKVNLIKKEKIKMRIAIPVTEGRLSSHFGHCEQFTIIEVDDDSKTTTKTEMLTPPAHEPGVLPRWLHNLGVNLIIAGGMGQKARQLFEENNVDVVVGAPDNTPEQLVKDYLLGNLKCGPNVCNH